MTEGIERLLRLAREWEEHSWSSVGKVRARMLAEIADQIERELDKVARTDWEAVRDVADDMGRKVFGIAETDALVEGWVRTLNDALDGRARQVHDTAADVSMSAYDLLPKEERDAIAWVRERGGIEHARDQWDYLKGRANHADHVDRKLAKRQRQIDESHAALRRRNELLRRYRDANEELLERGAAMKRRLMPEGMEWPRFEDGELVDFGDDVAIDDDGARSVDKVVFYGDQWRLYDRYGCEINEDMMGPGERMKRPAPNALDADGAETRVGDTVWDVYGFGPFTVRRLPSNRDMTVLLERDGTFYCRYAERLTHERPDSLELFEDDCDAISEAEGDEASLYAALADYCARRGLLGDDHISLVARDLARRARALEGRA